MFGSEEERRKAQEFLAGLREAELYLVRYDGPPHPAVDHLRTVLTEVEERMNHFEARAQESADKHDELLFESVITEGDIEDLQDKIQDLYDEHSGSDNKQLVDVLRDLLNT